MQLTFYQLINEKETVISSQQLDVLSHQSVLFTIISTLLTTHLIYSCNNYLVVWAIHFFFLNVENCQSVFPKASNDVLKRSSVNVIEKFDLKKAENINIERLKLENSNFLFFKKKRLKQLIDRQNNICRFADVRYMNENVEKRPIAQC